MFYQAHYVNIHSLPFPFRRLLFPLKQHILITQKTRGAVSEYKTVKRENSLDSHSGERKRRKSREEECPCWRNQRKCTATLLDQTTSMMGGVPGRRKIMKFPQYALPDRSPMRTNPAYTATNRMGVDASVIFGDWPVSFLRGVSLRMTRRGIMLAYVTELTCSMHACAVRERREVT